MKTWAYVNNGFLQEIIEPMIYPDEHPDWVEGQPTRTGVEIPIEERRTMEFIAACVDITGVDPQPQPGWVYIDGVFGEPVPYVPTAAEILSSNRALQSQLKTAASAAMTPYLLALALGNATTEETEKATAWQTYSRELSQLDLTELSPDWPTLPESN